MTVPYATAGTPSTQPHVITSPPSDDNTNQRIAAILIDAASVVATVKAIELILRPLGIGVDAIGAALRISGRGTTHKPRIELAGTRNRTGFLILRRQNNEELFYRAAYIVQAAYRIQRGLNARKTVRAVLADESINYRKHEKARTQRARAAKRTAVSAMLYGDLLGWYLNPLLNNEPECIAANGHNFKADEIPVIGLPGAVHPGCGCYAGPPIEGAGSVNDAVASHVIRGSRPKLVRLKRKAS